MPSERDVYRRFRLNCVVCGALSYLRTMPIYRPTSLLVVCPNCRNDNVLAIMPDKSLDGANQQNGYHTVQLVDLIYIENGLTEEEGDRLLWGNKNTLESRIEEYRRAIAAGDGSSAGSAGACTIPP
jgi:hypothetical protein